MLVLRPSQMEDLQQVPLLELEDHAFAHLQGCFPARCRKTGERVVREAIRYGIARARRHGFTTYRSVCTYLTLMLWLGSAFDEDPLYPWAAGILQGVKTRDEIVRIDMLQGAALRWLDRAEGAENEHLDAAVRRLLDQDLDALLPPPAGELHEWMLQQLGRLHPEKCRAAGDAPLRRLVRRGAAAGRRHGLTSARGQGVYIGMTFLLGAGFDADPLLPWARRVLDPAQAADQDAYGKTLHRAGVAYLRAALA